jgi:hypothetical protein
LALASQIIIAKQSAVTASMIVADAKFGRIAPALNDSQTALSCRFARLGSVIGQHSQVAVMMDTIH